MVLWLGCVGVVVGGGWVRRAGGVWMEGEGKGREGKESRGISFMFLLYGR